MNKQIKVIPKEIRMKIRKVIFEDHSAKTFNRPQWNKYLTEIRRQKGRGADLVLFTKWDRFSRNAGDEGVQPGTKLSNNCYS